jgi:phosphatidylserine/phosphatidylglycerophosphate/cardiolipin synthase-like enzyme
VDLDLAIPGLVGLVGALRTRHPGDCEIEVHAKLVIVDDGFLRIGSSNLNNRSVALDTDAQEPVVDDDELGVDLDLAIPGLVGLVGALRTRVDRFGRLLVAYPVVPGAQGADETDEAGDCEIEVISQSPASSVSSAPCAPGTTG